ncbi:hypothetical protein NXS19_005012 [Fusarium pseudograminearum]|nr:hypothetical protein NXS19_005012 [Fusarium pseudograminearum]
MSVLLRSAESKTSFASISPTRNSCRIASSTRCSGRKKPPLSVATLSGASQRNSKSVDLYELMEESPAKTLSRGLFLSISRLINTMR